MPPKKRTPKKPAPKKKTNSDKVTREASIASKRPDTQRPFEPQGVAEKMFFDVRDSGYWFPLQGRYVKLAGTELDDEFRVMGLRDDGDKKNGLDELRWVKHWARHHHQIEFAGPLAGYRKGLSRSTGRAMLITDEPDVSVWAELPRRKVERPVFLWEAMDEILGHDQAMIFCYWLSFALLALRRLDFSPGQAMILVGVSGCGKSFLQSLVTRTLGGRVADPMEYLTGKTNFNKKMTESEHWQVEDLQSSTEGKHRRNFGEILKRCVINERFTVHAKGKDSVDAPLFRRITLSLNLEMENLGKLPPLDGSLMDKLIIEKCLPELEPGQKTATLKCFQRFIPDDGGPELLPNVRSNGKPDRLKIQKAVDDELEDFRAWLLTLPALPHSLQDPRMGIAAYHHPELFTQLCGLDPWERMLQIVDALLWGDPKDAWGPFVGKAIELEEKLRGAGRFSFEIEKILRGNNACGSYLGRLVKRYPDRIPEPRKLDGYTIWTIKPPSKTPRE